MREADIPARMRLAFDLAVMAFGSRMEQTMAETKEIPMPKRPKNAQPTIAVPRWGVADLNRFLGIDTTDAGEPTEDDLDNLVAGILAGTEEWVE